MKACCLLAAAIALIPGVAPSMSPRTPEQKPAAAPRSQRGAITPETALNYMKVTPGLVVIDVREPQWIDQSFAGAIRIPWSEMDRRYREIPAGRPVLLHCGAGVMAPRAYRILREKRPDIADLAYIAGAPLFDAYNEWRKTNNQPSS